MAHERPTRTVYGPVPSRRLGRSLGVSPVPRKTCTYSCVYCQLGPTRRRTLRRRSFFRKEAILAEIAAALPGSGADYITFAGDGEPTLCSDLGWLVHGCKSEFETPVAAITNGSLLDRPDVRADLLQADVVMPSLDAGSAAVFRRINRPHRTLDYDAIVDGLVAFRHEYGGRLWLEVMLVDGLNDSAEDLRDLKAAIDRVQPDRVDLMVPTRPPAEAWVKAPAPSSVRRARRLLGPARGITSRERGAFGVAASNEAERAIMDVCLRHPLREAQARQMEQRMAAPGAVAALEAGGLVERVTYRGVVYIVPSERRAGVSGPVRKARPKR